MAFPQIICLEEIYIYIRTLGILICYNDHFQTLVPNHLSLVYHNGHRQHFHPKSTSYNFNLKSEDEKKKKRFQLMIIATYGMYPRITMCVEGQKKHVPTRSPANSPASSPPVPALTAR